MKKVLLIYDDRRMPGKQIRSITGDRSFGETILKRVKLSERIKGAALKNKDACDFIELADNDSFAKLNEDLIKRGYAENTAFFYMYSSFAINGERGFSFLLQKAAYAREVFCAKCRDTVAAVIFPDLKTLISYEERLDGGNVNAEQIDQDVFCDLSDQGNFRAYITGGFDARFFNALDGDEYTVTKRSPKREKLKSEYKFYELLPDDMKQWFVMPYDFREDDKGASYTMERIHTTDIAIRYVHGAVSEEELEDILGKLFYFLDHRKTKKTDEKTAQSVAEEAYVNKVKSRIGQLKEMEHFSQFDEMISMGTDYEGIDDVVKKYEKLYREIRKRTYARKDHSVSNRELVIGHGDLCFSNILYSGQAGLLKLIDPKGALNEDEMYMDPYYDLAKLSHSICGGYDFFNSGLYEVSLSRDLKWVLSIDAELKGYTAVFKKFLEEAGYDFSYVRICEAGLFLSMTPLHMDQPGKVFAFLLNAIRIMEGEI